MSGLTALPGSWLLFVGKQARQLARVDVHPIGPVSARKITSAALRHGLLPVVAECAAGRRPSGTFPLVAHGAEWDAHVRTVRAPKSSAVIGVLATLVPRGDRPSEPPAVGTWEWRIDLDRNGAPTPQRTTYWDRSLFDIYEVAPSVPERSAGCWEVPVWANELVAAEDQARLLGSIREGIRRDVDGVRTLTYRINTGRGTTTTGSKQLRLLGSIGGRQPDGTLAIHGVSHEVPTEFTEPSLEREGARVDDVLRGAMQLSSDPMCLVDPDSMEILMTSSRWKAVGLGRASSVIELFDERAPEIEQFIEAARRGTSTTTLPGRAWLTSSDGTSRSVLVQACGVDARTAPDMDVLVRLELTMIACSDGEAR